MDSSDLRHEILQELKSKFGKIILVLILGVIIGWYLAFITIVKIKAKLLPKGVEIIALTPLEFVIVQLKLSLIFAIVILIPVIVFIATRRVRLRIKKRTMFTWGMLLLLFFVGGILFAYNILLPFVIRILTSTVVETGIEPLYSLSGFMFFSISMMLILGLVFEFPVITAWLSRTGIISSQILTERRKYAYVGIFVVAAVITPDPSPVSQMLVALPFLFFYEVSVITAKIFGRRQKST
jgi:sec-independent protein translocase protein TatC